MCRWYAYMSCVAGVCRVSLVCRVVGVLCRWCVVSLVYRWCVLCVADRVAGISRWDDAGMYFSLGYTLTLTLTLTSSSAHPHPHPHPHPHSRPREPPSLKAGTLSQTDCPLPLPQSLAVPWTLWSNSDTRQERRRRVNILVGEKWACCTVSCCAPGLRVHPPAAAAAADPATTPSCIDRQVDQRRQETSPQMSEPWPAARFDATVATRVCPTRGNRR